MSSMSLEERKRKLAEARAAREAKDKQVVELGEQLAKMQGSPVIDSVAPKPSASDIRPVQASPNIAVHPSMCISEIQKGIATVDIPPLVVNPVEMYSKAVVTEHVYIYDSERPDPVSIDTPADGESPSGEGALGLTMGRIGGMVWDRSGISSKLMKAGSFLNFVDTASAIMGSALSSEGASVGVFSSGAASKTSATLSKRGSFYSDAAIRDEMVIVAIAFQPGSTESFAVAYGSGDHPGSTLDGRLHDAVSIWNTRRSSPVSLQFKYEVHALCYSPFHPHYLFGGSAKGHIVLWDTRSSVAPSAVTFPSLNSHNMPIAFMRVVGDGAKSSIVSVSLDGRICLWNIDDIKHPVASMVVCSAHSDTARMSITSSCVPLSLDGRDIETSRVFFGGPKGTLHVATRNIVDRRIIATQFSAIHHDGTINAIDAHPPHEDSSISNLILTASSDWSCRVWSGEASVKIAMHDIVLDAKWCPTRPSMFAACDASGRVSLWDIVHSTQTPIGVLGLEDSTAPGGKGLVMLHRLAWDDSGEHLIVGGNQGEAYYIIVNLANSGDSESTLLTRWVSRNLAPIE